MNGYLTIILIFLYCAWKATSLWKKKFRREAAVLCMLSLIAGMYFVPSIGDQIPTPSSINIWLYKPIAEYVKRKVNFVPEEYPL